MSKDYQMTREEAETLFTYKHLPQHLQEVSVIFANAADDMCEHVRQSNYRTKALWKLWEAKNLAVAAVAQKP
jgi:hypothetical protein